MQPDGQQNTLTKSFSKPHGDETGPQVFELTADGELSGHYVHCALENTVKTMNIDCAVKREAEKIYVAVLNPEDYSRLIIAAQPEMKEGLDYANWQVEHYDELCR